MLIIGGITLNRKMTDFQFSKRQRILKEGQDPAQLTADSLFKIIKFMFYRVPKKQKSKLMSRLRGKIVRLNPGELGLKNMPPSTAIGQAVSMTKNLLSGLNPAFTNKVIMELVKLLATTTQEPRETLREMEKPK